MFISILTVYSYICRTYLWVKPFLESNQTSGCCPCWCVRVCSCVCVCVYVCAWVVCVCVCVCASNWTLNEAHARQMCKSNHMGVAAIEWEWLAPACSLCWPIDDVRSVTVTKPAGLVGLTTPAGVALRTVEPLPLRCFFVGTMLPGTSILEQE